MHVLTSRKGMVSDVTSETASTIESRMAFVKEIRYNEYNATCTIATSSAFQESTYKTT